MDQIALIRANALWQNNNGTGKSIDDCEATLGPSAGECGDGRFGFTLLFELCFLAGLPSVLLLLTVPWRLRQLSGQNAKVQARFVGKLKIAACVAFGVLQMVLLVLWAIRSYDPPAVRRATITVSALGIADALALSLLSRAEHTRSIRPSSTLSIYLVFSVIADAVQLRTLLLLRHAEDVAPVFAAALAVRVIMLVLEARPKQNTLMPKWQQAGPEATSGIINRSFLWWLNGLLVRGYSDNLSKSPLYNLDDALQSEPLLNRMRVQWRLRRVKGGKYPLLWALLLSIRAGLAACVVPRLLLAVARLAQPLLITRVIRYLEQQGDGGETLGKGYGLILATCLIYGGKALVENIYAQKQYRISTMIRGSLTSLIMYETVDIDAASKGSTALTLISSDVGSVCNSLDQLHEVWGSSIEVAFALWLLERQLHIGAIGPIFIIGLSYVLMPFASRAIPPAAMSRGNAIEKRVTVTSAVITSMKEVKMLGLATVWLEKVQDLMTKEMARTKVFRGWMVFMNVTGNLPGILAPAAAFGFAIVGQSFGSTDLLSVSVVFTSLAILNLTSGTIAQLLFIIPELFSSLAAFERIQKFLEQVHDARELRGESIQGQRAHSYADDFDNAAAVPDQSRMNDATIVLENASFRFAADDTPILQNISVSIPSRSLTAVVGKVGSGKSVFLKALLGELQATGKIGKLSSPDGVAYCAQTPWLLNSTIQDNILGQSQMDKSWYNSVVHACALGADFADLQSGDRTLVGTKGISLSGGQKHRVALARALYSKKQVLLVDDILSGLDWGTQAHIWTQAFGPEGLARKNQLTVVLGTHHLANIQDADNIIVLGDGGNIICQGNYKTVSENEQFQNLQSHGTAGHSSDSSSTKQDDTAVEHDGKEDKSMGNSQADEDDVGFLLQQSGDWSLYGYYFKHVGTGRFVVTLTTGIIMSALSLINRTWPKIWSEANERNGGSDTMYYYSIYLGLGSTFIVLLGFDMWNVLVLVGNKSTWGIHRSLLKSVMAAPLSYFVATDAGDIINRFSKDVGLVDSDMAISLFIAWHGLRSVFTNAILVLPGSSYGFIAIPFIAVFLYVLQKVYLRTSRQLRYLDIQTAAPLNTHLLETMEGLTTLRAFGWRAVCREKSLILLDESQKPHYLLFCIQRWLSLVLDLFTAGLAVLLVGLGVLLPSSTSKGAMALSLTSVLALGTWLMNLIYAWTRLETSLGALARIKSFEERSLSEAPPALPECHLPEQWPIKGDLEFRDVTASYSSEPNGELVLNRVSIQIRTGEKVAICGRTGSGKSSLLLTLFKLLDLRSGNILVDGTDISHVEQNQLRRRLISIPQEPTIFPGTVRSNLWFTESEDDAAPSDEELQEVLKKIELWDMVSSLSEGLESDMSSVTLSQGQKQLLCLGRALLRRTSSAILVLDEAMSAVDGHTERVMVRVLETEFADHTVLSVVHRLNTIRDFDRVIVLQQGKIVEEGAPGVLLDKPESNFRSLWNRHS